jgi:hypothetical protein
MFVFESRDSLTKEGKQKVTHEPRKYIILDETKITEENREEIKEYRMEYEEQEKHI